MYEGSQESGCNVMLMHMSITLRHGIIIQRSKQWNFPTLNSQILFCKFFPATAHTLQP